MTSSPTRPRRPALRWHGGKWKLASWIIGYLPTHQIYTEVFGGAASVLMHKPRTHSEIYNDLDGDVINFFRVLQDPILAARLKDLLRVTPFAREEFDLAYELVPDGDAVERARRLVIVSFMGFGSNAHNTKIRTGFRSNCRKQNKTSAHSWINQPNTIDAVVVRLQGVVIESRSAIKVLERHDSKETVHYVDPPYLHGTRGKGMQRNYRHEMTDDDHRELGDVLHRLEGSVILSGYPSDLYDQELFPHWRRVSRLHWADSNVGARQRTEVLWLNPRAQEKLDQEALDKQVAELL